MRPPWAVRYCSETLAAAYAEDGQFDEAVKWQIKAITFAATDPIATNKVKAQLRSTLALYKQGKPYREERP